MPFLLFWLAFAQDGESVQSGTVVVTRPDPNTVVVDQTSAQAIVNWQNFSVAAGNQVIFNQPDASSAILNRVVGGNPSLIAGSIQANGQVTLINPNGILFSATAQIDVAGLVASTLALSDADFITGNQNFVQDPMAALASVTNLGLIQAQAGGVSLIAGNGIEATGVLSTNGGIFLVSSGGNINANVAPGFASISAITSGDISLTQTGAAALDSAMFADLQAGGTVSLSNPGGDIILNSALFAGIGNSLDVQSGGTIAIDGPVSTSGDVTLTASAITLASGQTLTAGNVDCVGDAIDLFGSVDSNSVTIKPMSPSFHIFLGPMTLAAPRPDTATYLLSIGFPPLTSPFPPGTPYLRLVCEDLQRITATEVHIGGPAVPGIYHYDGLNYSGIGRLTLESSGPITGGGALGVSSLRIWAGGFVSLFGANRADTLEAIVSGAGERFDMRVRVNTIRSITTNGGLIDIRNFDSATQIEGTIDAGSGDMTLFLNLGMATVGAGLVKSGGDIFLRSHQGDMDISLDPGYTSLTLHGGGAITIRTPRDLQISSFDLTLTTWKPDSVSIIGGNLIVDDDRLAAYPKDIVLSASGDVIVSGELSTATDISITAGGSIQINAPLGAANLTLNSGMDMVFNNLSLPGGTITFNTPGTVALTNVDASAIVVNAPGGAQIVNTGALTISGITSMGPLTLQASTLAIDGAVDGAEINLTADSMVFTAPLTGTEVNIEKLTPGTQLTLGNGGMLDDASLDFVSAGILRIGSSGNIRFIDPISPAGVATLTLISGGGVTQLGNSFVAVPNLRVTSREQVTMPSENVVSILAAQVLGEGEPFVYHTAIDVTLGTVDGVTGVTTNDGPININNAAAWFYYGTDIRAGSGDVFLTFLRGVRSTGGVIRTTGNITIVTGADLDVRIALGYASLTTSSIGAAHITFFFDSVPADSLGAFRVSSLTLWEDIDLVPWAGEGSIDPKDVLIDARDGDTQLEKRRRPR